MTADVTGDFSAASGVAYMDCILKVEFFGEGGEIVGVGVHLVAVPGLSRPAVAAPVVRDDSIATLAEEQHLSVPVVRAERPSVTEHYGLAFSPVLVIDSRAVFHCDCLHDALLSGLNGIETVRAPILITHFSARFLAHARSPSVCCATGIQQPRSPATTRNRLSAYSNPTSMLRTRELKKTAGVSVIASSR